MTVMSIFKKIKPHLLLYAGILAVPIVFAQPSLSEIKKFNIKSSTEISRDDTAIYSKKIVYNIYGHDSLIYYDGKLAFYTKSEVDSGNRLKQLIFFNSRNDLLEELLIFKYRKNGSYTIEIIAHGAGLIETREYNPEHQLLKSSSSDHIETTYQYNNDGKPEKIFQKNGKEKKKLVGLTKFDENGLEFKTEVFGESPGLIFYEHNSNGLVIKIRLQPKDLSQKEEEIVYQYEFYRE